MMMKIKFKQQVIAEATLDICCFSGQCRKQIWEFDSGEIFEVKEVILGEVKKVKTRPGAKGGRFRMCTLILNGNENSIHPDYISEIPESAFEIIE
jgi:hypothetical protein